MPDGAAVMPSQRFYLVLFFRSQFVDCMLEIVQIFEVLIHACKAHVGHLIQIAQRFEDGSTDFIRFDFGKTAGTQVLFNPLSQQFQVFFLNGAALACFAYAGDYLITVKGFDVAGAFCNQQHS